MGKSEKTIVTYTCDKCGKQTGEESKIHFVTKHGFVGIVRWFIPALAMYKKYYLCDECFKDLGEWLKPKEEA